MEKKFWQRSVQWIKIYRNRATKPYSAVTKYFGSCCYLWFTYCSLVSNTTSFVFHRHTRSSRTTDNSRRWFREYFQFQGHELNTLTSNSTNSSVQHEGARNPPGELEEGMDQAERTMLIIAVSEITSKNQLCPWINPYKLCPGPCCSPPRSCTLRWVLDCSEYKQTAQWPISGFQVYAKRCNLLLFFRLMYYYFMYL